MSRIGKKPVAVPDGVEVRISGRTVRVKGARGELSRDLPDCISAKLENGEVRVERGNESRSSRSLHGLSRSLVANMVEGVSKGYRKELQIEGVGFRAQVQGQTVVLSLGFANPKEFRVPEGVKVTEQGGTRLSVEGTSKEMVGEVAARIRGYYPAEPYKGKGIRYVGEQVRRKVGKTVA